MHHKRKGLSMYHYAHTFFSTKNQAVCDALNEKLAYSAFRYGVSPAISGITKIAPSDHLPITTCINGITCASWNLLCDDYISNFFLDVADKPYLLENLSAKTRHQVGWHVTLKQLGMFVLEHASQSSGGQYEINLHTSLLDDFIKASHENVAKMQRMLANNPSQNLDGTIALKQYQCAVEEAKNAEEIVTLFTDSRHPNHNDFKNSLIHAIELAYSISKGNLQWSNRFKKIAEDKTLINNLISHDVLCFQECTSPSDMLTLLQTHADRMGAGKKFSLIKYPANPSSNDHCVLIYDENILQLDHYDTFNLSFNPYKQQFSKPCIIGQFRNLSTQETLQVGSIHHPCSGESKLPVILEKARANGEIPTIILGDFNHAASFYKNELIDTNFALTMPTRGTMAGFENGTHNQPIDGVLTNTGRPAYVNVFANLTVAEQIALPLAIKIDFEVDKDLEKVSQPFAC